MKGTTDMLRTHALLVLATLLTAQTPPPAPVAKPPAETVLARIGKRVIREADLEAFIEAVFPEPQRKQIDTTPGALEKIKANYLESLVLAIKARQAGLDKTADFKQQLAFAEIRVLATIAGEKAREEVKKRAEVREDEQKAYYTKNLEQYKTPASFDARHILIAVKGGAGSDKGLSDEEAKAKAEKVLADLKAGKSWDEEAKEHSNDPGNGRLKGGLYQNVPYGRFAPEFDAAVRTQELGKVGGPVKAKAGYHVIQVEKRADAEQQPFEKVKEQVRSKLSGIKQEEARRTYMEELRKEIGYVEGPAAAAEPVKEKTKAKTAPARTH